DEHDNHYRIRYTKSIIERFKAINKDLEEINKNQKDHKKLLELLGAITKSNHEPYNDLLKRAIETKLEHEGFAGVRSAILDEAYSPKPAAANDRIRIMSLHSAKGLNASTVIIMSAVDGLIPLRGKGSLEEQRRLFYVAITRCKEDIKKNIHGRLVITTFTESNNGTTKDISRFVLEMGKPIN
ncbi:MAG: ATP-dependent helicase, partial [Oscillospiraceae bacterium]|nr:ATP-dependent helicase [Oscillospiraceae bacterium]